MAYKPQKWQVKAKISLLILSFAKLWLVAVIPITAVGWNIHDDRLFLNLAHHIVRGNWLGAYDQLTLIKGPFYPLWIAFTFHVGVPLLFAQHLLYLAACLSLASLFKHMLKNQAALVMVYAFFIFSPHLEEITRVLRAGVYTPLSVIVIAGLMEIYGQRQAKPSARLLGALFTGIALAAFWLTREEGIWILPSVILILGSVVWLNFRSLGLGKKFYKRTVVCLLPIVVLISGIQLVSFINKVEYCVHDVVEFKQAAFKSAYGALTRVQHPQFIRYLPVPKAVRTSIYGVSPAFAELEFILETQLKGWQQFGCRAYPETCGDIAGGWFVWALRDAVSRAGYYRSAEVSEQYYVRLAKEINIACEQGDLACLPQRGTMLRLFRSASPQWVWQSLRHGISKLLTGFPYPIHAGLTSQGSMSSIQFFSDMTRSSIAPADFVFPAPARSDGLKIAVLQKIAAFYREVMPWLGSAAMAAFLASLGLCLHKKRVTFGLVFNTAILMAVGTRLLILAYLDATCFYGFIPNYMSPLYPLWYAFVACSLVDMAGLVVSYRQGSADFPKGFQWARSGSIAQGLRRLLKTHKDA